MRYKPNTQLVAEFMKAFGQSVSQGWDNPHVVELGMKLIEEECKELRDEADAVVKAYFAPKYCNHELIRTHFIKELADLEFVVHWMAAAIGIDLDSAVREVWQSNMSKLGEDGLPIYREDGKVLKGPNYHEPDLSHVLKFVPIAL
jgi:predicted HAD superfamily Cof-like phosphohydrolase